MKKILLGIALLFPLTAISADDSVYTWGVWSQGVQPAAGAVVHIARPSPVQTPNINIRANENSAFFRNFTAIERVNLSAAASASQNNPRNRR